MKLSVLHYTIMNSDEERKEKQRKADKKKNFKECTKIIVDSGNTDITCGLRFLQPLATRPMYLIVYCIVGLVMGMYFTYAVATISTLEKRFKLNSKLTGIILAGNDVSQVLFSILASYYCNYGNRPKWLGLGVLSASFSCFLSALPHFIYGPGQDAIQVAKNFNAKKLYYNMTNSTSLEGALLSTDKYDLCYSPYVGDCSEEILDEESVLGPVVILFIGQFFVGLAVSVYYSIGLVYLDDNVNKKDTPLFYGLSMIVRTCGPVMGFLLGSKCLSLYIDPNYKPNISLRDPRWMGAWWLGYIILGVFLGLSSLLMLVFPRYLPITMYKRMQLAQAKEHPTSSKTIDTTESNISHLLGLVKSTMEEHKPYLKGLPEAMKRLFTNKIWVGHTFNTVLDLFAMMGYWSFKPKYLEYQFRKSATVATFYTGVAGLVSSIVGLALSAIILRVFRPGPRYLSGYMCFLTLFSSATMISLMFISCPKIDVVGPDYAGDVALINSGCNFDCECTDRYSPVCSADGTTTFYSSCYAGCKRVNSSVMPVEYYDCQCIQPLNGTYGNDKLKIDEMGQAIHGYCPEKCENFFYYIIATIITKGIASSGRIGGSILYLRSVEEHDKGLSLGTLTFMLSLFAFIPSPIIMGAIIDSACIIWDNTCDRKGNCWLYDSDQFRILIHAVPAAIILVGLIGDIVVFMNSKDLVLYGEDEKIVLPNTPPEVEEFALLEARRKSVDM